jgi:hypothetical protein
VIHTSFIPDFCKKYKKKTFKDSTIDNVNIMTYICHLMDCVMKEKNELLKVFKTLSPANQAGLLCCARIARTAEEAARKAVKKPHAQQRARAVKPKKEE